MTQQFLPKFGYYSVGVQIFANKITALTESKKSGVDCIWHFNDDVFSKFDWLTPPTIGLKEVYKNRALQLRNKYDYIVLNYSGGADSHNILRAFLDNNIKLDEICVRNPWKRTEGIYQVSTDTDPGNHMSEWYLTTLPDLEYLRKHYPGIKIELYDQSDDQIEFWKSADADNNPWFLKGLGAMLGPNHAMRYKALDRYKRMFTDKGIKGCQLYGIDKPKMCYKNGSFYVFYLDTLVDIPAHYDGYDDAHDSTELFYWTPDMPEIIKVQTHHVMNVMKQNVQLLSLISPEAAKSYTLRNQYEVMVRDLVYPYWDNKRFQVKKPSSIIWCELDNWMFDDANADSTAIGTWNYSLDYIEQSVDQKHVTYKDGVRDGLAPMSSPLYKIGDFTF